MSTLFRLYSDQEGGMMFEADGLMKHRWKWDTTSNTFRPTTIALNKHLTVKCQSKVQQNSVTYVHVRLIMATIALYNMYSP